MFGGSLSLAQAAVDLAAEAGPPDVVLASDMLDLPSFLGHSQPHLGNPHTVLYMHENQTTYPLSPTARDDLAYAYMNWSSMVRADQVWFNSDYHRDQLQGALPKFLGHFPDHRHSSLIEEVVSKVSVHPVGVDLEWVREIAKTEPPLVVWNQRWEYDKDPARFLNALYRLSATGTEFRVAICGENFRNVPSEFDEASERLGNNLTHIGYADLDEYRRILHDASVVVSTAKHEFFGVAAVEAMAAGAVPVFPNELSYPGLIPAEVHSETLYDSDTDLDQLLARVLSDTKRRHSIAEVVAPAMERYSWVEVAPEYDRALIP
jgi:glycosyltransferase involved in cell wall biosynthesis